MNFTSDQEVFDHVVGALLKQGKPAYNMTTVMIKDKFVNKVACAYRDDDGNKCAAGQVIPDDVYVKGMEGKVITSLIATYAALAHLGQCSGVLSRLQSAHDLSASEAQPVGASFVDANKWTELFTWRAAKVAQDFKLDPKALERPRS